MSADWPILTLGDVCEKITDGAHNSPKSVLVGKPMASVKDLTRFGVDLSNARLIASDEFEKLVNQGCQPQIGDVLIAKDGNSALDTVCTVDAPLDAVLLSSVAILRPNKAKLDSDFLKYYFCSPIVIEYLKNNFISGAAIPRVVLKDFRKAQIKLPPINIQKNISKILRSIDDKIELNTQTNQTLEQIAQSLFKSWFVDFDPVKAKIGTLAAGGSADDAELAAMSVISAKTVDELNSLKASSPEAFNNLAQTAALFPAAMQDSELGEIPEGWSILSLDEIANYQNGLALQKFRPKDENDFLPVVKIAGLKKGFADGEEKASPDIKPECIIDNGDVIFSWSGSLVVDIWCGGKAALNQHLFKVTSQKYPKWLYYYFTIHHLAEFQRIAADKAVTMGHIKREHLSNAKCAISNNDLIVRGTELIGSLVNKQIAQRLEKNNLAELRDLLLPKLLAGELNLTGEYLV